MSDGFSRPDPPTPTDEQSSAMDDMMVVGEGVDCRNCIHFRVCSYYAGIQPMLANEDDPVFEAHDLAVICEAFEEGET